MPVFYWHCADFAIIFIVLNALLMSSASISFTCCGCGFLLEPVAMMFVLCTGSGVFAFVIVLISDLWDIV